MGSKSEVIVGKKFGSWTVLQTEVKNPNSHAKRVRKGALCQCDCGTLRYIEYRSLYDKRTTNCGCKTRLEGYKKHQKQGEIALGEKFGDLTVIQDIGMINGTHKCKCKCKCGNIINVTNDHLKSGHTKSCGCRTLSFGAEKIKNLLIEHKIPFIQEYTFSDLKSPSGGFLRFDFAIFKDSQLYELIEFDGIQHFKPCSGYFENKLKQIQQYDKIKNDYCKNHNIQLIRIPYYKEKNIDLKLLKLDNILTLEENK